MLLILNLMKGWIKSASSMAVTAFPLWYLYSYDSKPSGFSGNSFLVHFVIFQMSNDMMTL